MSNFLNVKAKKRKKKEPDVALLAHDFFPFHVFFSNGNVLVVCVKVVGMFV